MLFRSGGVLREDEGTDGGEEVDEEDDEEGKLVGGEEEDEEEEGGHREDPLSGESLSRFGDADARES